MKKIISLVLALVLIFTFASCGKGEVDKNATKEGSLLYDLGIFTTNAVTGAAIIGSTGDTIELVNADDFAFLQGYNYKEVYAIDSISELYDLSKVKLLTVYADGRTFNKLYILPDGDIVATFGSRQEVKSAKTYSATGDYVFDKEMYTGIVNRYVLNPQTRQQLLTDPTEEKTEKTESEKTSK